MKNRKLSDILEMNFFPVQNDAKTRNMKPYAILAFLARTRNLRPFAQHWRK